MGEVISWLATRPTAINALGFPVEWITERDEINKVLHFLLTTGG